MEPLTNFQKQTDKTMGMNADWDMSGWDVGLLANDLINLKLSAACQRPNERWFE